jgi:DNA-binding FrmR family transcriptional regulator
MEGWNMSHTIQEKSKLLARVRRIKGQVQAIESALENEIGCADVLQLVASVRGAFNGLTRELIEEHIESHILATDSEDARQRGASELIEVIRTYVK